MAVLTKEEAGIALGTEEGNVEIMSLNDSFKCNGPSNERVKEGKLCARKHLRETLARFLTWNTCRSSEQ